MTLWRLILAVIALSYAGFGFAFLFNPDAWSAAVSITFTGPQGRTDFRAMYGGLEFGVGIFLLLCVFRREFVRIGLFAGACTLVAMATARSTGMLLDGFDLLQFFIVLTEWLGGGIATWGALMAKPERDSVPTPLHDPTPDEPPTAA
jgi:hypothetical protein